MPCGDTIPRPTQAAGDPEGRPSNKATKRAKARRYTRPSVCLDYLKGECTSKRFHCRFLHPDLADLQLQCGSAGDGAAQVCEVWALTGRCKFGPNCKKLHLPRDSANICSQIPPPRTAPVDPQPSLLEVPTSLTTDSEEDFEAFASSLLSPFTGVNVGDTDAEPRSPEGEKASSAASDLSDGSVGSDDPWPLPCLLAVLAQPRTRPFDRIFLDILGDLHLTLM